MANIDLSVRVKFQHIQHCLESGQKVLILLYLTDLNFDIKSVPGIEPFMNRGKTDNCLVVIGNLESLERLRHNPAIKSANPCLGAILRVTRESFNPNIFEGVVVTSNLGDVFGVVLSAQGLESIEKCELICGVML